MLEARLEPMATDECAGQVAQPLAMPRSGRRGRPSAEDIRMRKAMLLKVTRQQFLAHGYHKATMNQIAAAAGVTKRTLYLWHKDKIALFEACIDDGATRFPTLVIAQVPGVSATLEQHMAQLIVAFSQEEATTMTRIYLSETGEFPRLAAIIDRSRRDYVVDPVAAYLRDAGLEAEGSTDQAELLLALAFIPIHAALLYGKAFPTAAEAQVHAAQATAFFLRGAGFPAIDPSTRK